MPSTRNKNQETDLISHQALHLRSEREAGLHERACRAGVTLPVPISWITVPITAEDGEIELTQWPILLPYDFVPHLYFHCLFFGDPKK